MNSFIKPTAAVLALLIILSAFAACGKVSFGNKKGYQCIADFNSGTVFEDYGNKFNRLDSSFSFGEGDKRLKFNAEFTDDRILYTVTDMTDDRIAEMKTFGDIYSIYYDNWNEYDVKVLGGNGVTTEKSEDGQIETIILYISGNKYTAEFAPNEPTPYIEIKKTEIA